MSYSVIVVNRPENKPTDVELVVSSVDYNVAIKIASNRYKAISGNGILNEKILLDFLTKYNRVDFYDTSIHIKAG